MSASRRPTVLVLAAAAAVGLVACGAPRPEPNAACLRAPDRYAAAIEAGLEGAVVVDHVFLLESPSAPTFVSAERKERDKDEDEDGDILTWIVVSDDRTDVTLAAVDVVARDESTWPPADVTVQAPGALTSRGCTYNARVDDDDSRDEQAVAEGVER